MPKLEFEVHLPMNSLESKKEKERETDESNLVHLHLWHQTWAKEISLKPPNFPIAQAKFWPISVRLRRWKYINFDRKSLWNPLWMFDIWPNLADLTYARVWLKSVVIFWSLIRHKLSIGSSEWHLSYWSTLSVNQFRSKKCGFDSTPVINVLVLF